MADSQITKLSGLQINPDPNSKNNGFYAPKLTTAQIAAIPAGTVQAGGIVYNTTLNCYQCYQTYTTSNAAPLTTSAWLTLMSIPTMTAAQGVFFEAANTTPGQMYIRSDTHVVRIYQGAAWGTITVT